MRTARVGTPLRWSKLTRQVSFSPSRLGGAAKHRGGSILCSIDRGINPGLLVMARFLRQECADRAVDLGCIVTNQAVLMAHVLEFYRSASAVRVIEQIDHSLASRDVELPVFSAVQAE